MDQGSRRDDDFGNADPDEGNVSHLGPESGQLRVLVKQWIQLALWELAGNPASGRTPDMKQLEEGILSELVRLISARGVDPSGLKAKLVELLLLAPHFMFNRDLKIDRIQAAVEDLKGELHTCLTNPALQDLADELVATVKSVLTDPSLLLPAAECVRRSVVLIKSGSVKDGPEVGSPAQESSNLAAVFSSFFERI